MTTTDKTLAMTATILALLMTTALAKAGPRKKNAAAPQAEPTTVAAAAPAPAPATALPPKADDAPAAAPAAPSNGKPAAAEKSSKDEDDSDAPGEVSPSGFTMSARAGYAIPMGSIAKDSSLGGATDLSKTVSGMAPIWGDFGYRINPNWYVGGYFQLGIISTAGDYCKRAASGNACTSSGTDIRFGGIVKYTFKPSAKFSPWIGASSGYEITNVSITVGQNSADESVKGWEFIGLHVGADFHVTPGISLGPAVMASFGQYSSTSWSRPNSSGSADFTNTALHEWVFIGANGRFDL